MSEDQKLRVAKELAARTAVATYGEALRRYMQEHGLDLSALDGTGHELRTAIFDGRGNAVVIRTRWEFTIAPEDVAAHLRRARPAGQG